jgi:hypothetical protein
MSIIFQLFSAEDLQKLDIEELKGLRDEIKKALEEAGMVIDDKLHLNLKEKVKPDENSPFDQNSPPEWVREALLKRFNEVSHQLKTPPISPSQQAFNFDALIAQRKSQETQDKEELILNWAISCELNHIEFYFPLLKAREAAYKYFEDNPRIKEKLQIKEKPQAKVVVVPKEVRTKEPDSAYSPFNPRHPLYRQYDDISKSAPEPTEQTPPYTP